MTWHTCCQQEDHCLYVYSIWSKENNVKKTKKQIFFMQCWKIPEYFTIIFTFSLTRFGWSSCHSIWLNLLILLSEFLHFWQCITQTTDYKLQIFKPIFIFSGGQTQRSGKKNGGKSNRLLSGIIKPGTLTFSLFCFRFISEEFLFWTARNWAFLCLCVFKLTSIVTLYLMLNQKHDASQTSSFWFICIL